MVNLSDYLLTLLSIALGFGLGYAVRPLEDWFSNRARRRRLAIVLSSEIEAIKASAENSIKLNTPTVEEARKSLQPAQSAQPDQPGIMSFTGVEIADVDFPTQVYESTLGEVGLFKPDLVVLLTDFYRWVGYAHARKAENQKFSSDAEDLMRTVMAREPRFGAELDYLRYKVGAALHCATVYLRILDKVASLADDAIKELAKIGKQKPSRRVDVQLQGGVFRETFP